MLKEEKSKIKEDQDWMSVPLEMISHIIQVKEITLIYTLDGKAHLSSQIINKFERKLKAYGFEKANHITLVNTKHVKEIYRNSGRIITLKNNIKIKISRRRMYKFKLHLINID